jgi:hypothetical protein
VVSLLIRGKYWVNNNEIKVLISTQPERFLFGMIAESSLVVSVMNSMQTFHDGTFLERGFYEVPFVEGLFI